MCWHTCVLWPGGSEDMWVSPGVAAVALTGDIPAAHLGPPCPAPLVGPAKQKEKNMSAGVQAVGEALLPHPICSCLFVPQISLPVPCSFGEAKHLGWCPKEHPNQLGVWARALIPVLHGFYSGCKTDSSMLVDPHGAIKHPCSWRRM